MSNHDWKDSPDYLAMVVFKATVPDFVERFPGVAEDILHEWANDSEADAGRLDYYRRIAAAVERAVLEREAERVAREMAGR